MVNVMRGSTVVLFEYKRHSYFIFLKIYKWIFRAGNKIINEGGHAPLITYPGGISTNSLKF